MSKVIIHTIVDCINYGALLQAYALSSFVRDSLGHSVFLQTKKPQPLLTRLLRSFLKQRHITASLLERQTAANLFKSFFLSCHYFDNNLLLNGDFHLVGSDEVLSGGYYSTDVMRGCSASTSLLTITYAMTIGTPNNIPRLTQVGFNEWSYKNVACRDQATIQLFHSLGRQDAYRVCDPTLLISQDQWLSISNSLSNDFLLPSEYVLIYSDFPNAQIKQLIIDFLGNIDLPVLLLGCLDDENFNSVPNLQVLGANYPIHMIPTLFHGASYVITSFFHGLMFSFKFRKPFILSYNPEKSPKIEDFLHLFRPHLPPSDFCDDSLWCNYFKDCTPILDDLIESSTQSLAKSLS